MNVEEILVRLGVDTSSMQGGLNKATGLVGNWAAKLGASLFERLGSAHFITRMAIEFIKWWKEATDKVAQFHYQLIYGNTERAAVALDKERARQKAFLAEQRAAWAEEAKQHLLEVQREAEKQGLVRETLRIREELDHLAKNPTEIEHLEFLLKRAQNDVHQAQQEADRLHSTSPEGHLGKEEAAVRLDLEKHMLDVVKIKNDLNQKRLDQQQQEIANSKKLADIEAEIVDAKRQKARIAEQEYDAFRPTIQELSQVGFFRGPAAQIMALGEQAKTAFEFGNVPLAKRLVDVRNQRYDKLADLGIVPQRQEKAVDAQIKMEQHIRDLVDQRKAIKVKPSNGK